MNPKLSAALVAASLAVGGGIGAIATQPSAPAVTFPFQKGEVVVTSDCRCFLKGQSDVMRKCYEAAEKTGDTLPVCPR